MIAVSYQSYENDEETDDPYMSKPPNIRIERDFEKLVLINRTRPTPCDREMYLYQLDYNNLEQKLNKQLKDCDRPFYAQLVNYTNMLMVVVDATCAKDEVPILSVDALEVQYNESLPCLKHMHPLYRKQPMSCIRNHTEVSLFFELYGFGVTATIAPDVSDDVAQHGEFVKRIGGTGS